MTTMTLPKPQAIKTSRPRPGLAPRVAPPVEDTFAPWAAVLDQSLASGSYRWVMSDEGALVPVSLTEDEAAAQSKRGLATRLAALVRR